jgi:hypothetical protein
MQNASVGQPVLLSEQTTQLLSATQLQTAHTFKALKLQRNQQEYAWTEQLADAGHELPCYH